MRLEWEAVTLTPELNKRKVFNRGMSKKSNMPKVKGGQLWFKLNVGDKK